MRAVHFGAGNIGRGFIGTLLYQSGYEICFIDVNATLIDLINSRKEYAVVLADQTEDVQIVKNVSGINSQTDPDKAIEAIVQADLVTTAVGPNVLPLIAPLIVEAFRKRLRENKQPLNIIACENMIGASGKLKEHIYQRLDEAEKQDFDRLFGFPNAAVDRIVPNQENADQLMVKVEPFFEWVVETKEIHGKTPEIEGVTFVPDLLPYIERKLFSVNTGHAITAYIGYQAGCQTIQEAIENDQVRRIVEGALKETGELLIRKHGFRPEDHWIYVKKIVNRFRNPNISDEVTRVGRSPKRKLGYDDRLVGPARQYHSLMNEIPHRLVDGIAAALSFDFAGDDEAVAVQNLITNKGIRKAIVELTGLEESHPLIPHIESAYNKLHH